MIKYEYWVDCEASTGIWITYPNSRGSAGFAHGYFTALSELYPSPILRIVRSDGKVVQMRLGHGEVHIN